MRAIFSAGLPGYRASQRKFRSGHTIRADESGNPSGPPILLFPGWGCSVYAYRFTMPALAAAGFRVIGVDLKGHGLSDKPTAHEEYVIDSLVQHLVEILDALGLERPHLIGHSMG